MAFRIVFATDYHGIEIHYRRLFDFVGSQKISTIIFGGDLCPTGVVYNNFGQVGLFQREFLQNFFLNQLRVLKSNRSDLRFLVMMGNDDLRANFDLLVEAEHKGLVDITHRKIVKLDNLQFLGYSCVPPTPFLIKDWERYENASRIIEPIAIAPENGYHSVNTREKTTIEKDLTVFQEEVRKVKTIFVSHCPPYKTNLDYSTKDRYYYEGLKLDKHLGSIAIRNFIESAQPILSLHGHIHESTSISGKFQDRINNSICLNGAFHVEDTERTEIILIEVADELTFEKVTLT